MKFPIATMLRSMFGLDYRSLALLRIGLAGITLADLCLSACHLRAFYTDEGVLSRGALLANFGKAFSLHLAGGGLGFQSLMIAVHAALAVLMLVGYRTRLVTVACYVMLESLQARNPLVIFGADISLRVCFFWAMFLPLGQRFSLDAVLGRARAPENDTYLGMPGVAYLVQFALIYLFSCFLKTGPTWREHHTAVYYALSIEAYRRPLGAWLSQYDVVTAWLTVFTLYIEAFGPLLLILPVWSGWGRLIAITVFTALQVGFNVCMQMGLFGPVMIVVSLALLPTEFWSWFVNPMMRRWSISLQRLNVSAWQSRLTEWCRAGLGGMAVAATGKANLLGGLGAARWRKGFVLAGGLRDVAVLLLLVYVVLWNADTLPGRQPLIPDHYRWIGKVTGLNQVFDLFTPDPAIDDGWFVIAGQLKNGTRINAFTGERTVSYEMPADIAGTYIDQRWGAFLLWLWDTDGEPYMEPLAQYLGRQWNRAHTGNEQIRTIEITFMRQNVGPAHTRWPLAEELLWTQTFD